MADGKDKKKTEISAAQTNEAQDRLIKAEYALQLFSERLHARVEKLLNGIASHYRVVNDASVLDEIHRRPRLARKELRELLLQNSTPAGTILSSFNDGEIDIDVFSTTLVKFFCLGVKGARYFMLG